MKILLSAGMDNTINYPNSSQEICFEGWGNAWACIGDAFYRSGDFLIENINDLANECDVLFLELLPKQWTALKKLKKPCKAIIFGVSHAPPHNLEVESPLRKALMIEAWEKSDYLVAMDIGLEYYAPFFAPHAKLLRLPHPVPEMFPNPDLSGAVGIEIKKKDNGRSAVPGHAKRTKRAMLLHIMEEGHHDFDNYLTLKILESLGYEIDVIIRKNKIEEMTFWLDSMGFKGLNICFPMPSVQFRERVASCEIVCQLSGRPSLGRTIADAARVGTVSIASEYWYQRFLYPSLIVRTAKDMEQKIREIGSDPYYYQSQLKSAKEGLKALSPIAISEKLIQALEERIK